MELMAEAHSAATLDNILEQPAGMAQALRLALRLAVGLRSLHEMGQVCGTLDPMRIHLVADEVVIEPAPEANCTGYTAPELLTGACPDVRSDVFAFGAVLYRMVTGRKPFPGNSVPEITQAVREHAPAPLDLPAGAQQQLGIHMPVLERLIFRSLEKDPNQRWQNIRAVYIELKLLNTAISRAPAAEARRSVEAQLRQQIARLEATLTARLGACEQSVAGLDGMISETRGLLAGSIDSIDAKLHSQTESIGSLHTAVSRTDVLLERVVESIGACDRAMLEMQRAASGTREHVQQVIEGIEARLGSQAGSIEALKSSIGRTEDVLERVVESIDSLQSFVLERSAELAAE